MKRLYFSASGPASQSFQVGGVLPIPDGWGRVQEC